jgi:hypothetical protein
LNVCISLSVKEKYMNNNAKKYFDKLNSFIGEYVAIRSKRWRDGKIVKLQKDKYGIYWDEGWWKIRIEEEEALQIYSLTSVL